MIKYCALGLFRPATTHAFHDAKRSGQLPQFLFELTVCAAGIAGLALLSWEYVLLLYLPTFYFGWFLGHMENYYEHYGATPENKRANSVSYYGRLYNLLFCNEGYHQEHHFRPHIHWTQRPDINTHLADQLASPERRVSKFPPLLGFLDKR